MNKWKIGFWICFVLLFSIVVYNLYTSSNQAIDVVKTSRNFSKTVDDLNIVSRIINETDLTKNQIRSVLERHNFSELKELDKDTISLNTVRLVFSNNRLILVDNSQ